MGHRCLDIYVGHLRRSTCATSHGWGGRKGGALIWLMPITHILGAGVSGRGEEGKRDSLGFLACAVQLLVRVYLSASLRVCLSASLCVCLHAHLCVRVCIRMCQCISMGACRSSCPSLSACSVSCTHTHTHAHTHTHTCTHTHMHIHTITCTHTHTR